MAKRRGRPVETSKAQENADGVFVRLARDRSLAKLGRELGRDRNLKPAPVPKQNPLSGKKLKGQQRSPRAFGKVVLPEVAAEIGIKTKTLERHYREHGTGANDRVVAEILKRGKARDKAERVKRRHKAKQDLKEVFRRK